MEKTNRLSNGKDKSSVEWKRQIVCRMEKTNRLSNGKDKSSVEWKRQITNLHKL